MNKEVEKFISKFSQWGQEGHLPKRSLRKLSAILRKVIYEELPNRDTTFHWVERDIMNSANLNCVLVEQDVWLYPNGNKECLMVGSLFPFWDQGLRKLCVDEYIFDNISTFLFFASQYVGRSCMINALGAIALTYNRSCDFRGHSMTKMTVGNDSAHRLEDMFRTIPAPRRFPNGKEKELKVWCSILNSLDPYINRILFNYIRAINLNEEGFAEEAIVALDNTVDVSVQLLRQRCKGLVGERLDILALNLDLNARDIYILDCLYQLRCFFGAHPSVSKWWDFGETYEHSFNGYFDSIKTLIYKIAQFEASNRIVEKNPCVWSEWFNKNVMMLWDAVWFQRIPKV